MARQAGGWEDLRRCYAAAAAALREGALGAASRAVAEGERIVAGLREGGAAGLGVAPLRELEEANRRLVAAVRERQAEVRARLRVAWRVRRGLSGYRGSLPARPSRSRARA